MHPPLILVANRCNVVTCTLLDHANIYNNNKKLWRIATIRQDFFPQYSSPMKHVLWPSRERTTHEARHLNIVLNDLLAYERCLTRLLMQYWMTESL